MQEPFAEAPEQRHPWLRRLLPGALQPHLRGLRKRLALRRLALEEPYRTVYPYTTVSLKRQENLLRLGQAVEASGVLGAVVECGVLDGGTAALLAHATVASSRPLHLFDAWKGLPECTGEDGEAARKWVGQMVGSQRRVRHILATMGIRPDRVHFHPGWFHETFPRAEIGSIALLHVDCDFYAPTRLCLSTWYARLSPGGFVQIDDYGAYQGARQAVDEFLSARPELRLEGFGQEGRAYFFRRPA